MKSLLSKLSPTNYKSTKKHGTFKKDQAPTAQHMKKVIEECKELKEVKKEEEEKKLKLQFTRRLFQFESPNPSAPALESFVQIKYNEKKGRHLVVETPDGRDVPAGKFTNVTLKVLYFTQLNIKWCFNF